MYTSAVKGRHAELLAQTAFIAEGYTVLEPITTEPYDLAIRGKSNTTHYVQVKMAYVRDEKRYGKPYVVVKGHKGNGEVYSKDEVDFFAAVLDGKVYAFPNREKREYWTPLDCIDDKWLLLGNSLGGSIN